MIEAVVDFIVNVLYLKWWRDLYKKKSEKESASR
jgi:hypothetical protein